MAITGWGAILKVMLKPDQVKPLLLHTDHMVRSRAADYFANAGYDETDVAGLILQGMRRYDFKRSYTYVFRLRNLPVSTDAVPETLQLLSSCDDAAVRRDLNHVLGSLPLEFWARRGQEIGAAMHVAPATLERIERRRRLASLDGPTLFDQLIDLCDTKDIPDSDQGRDMMEAMVARSYPARDELVKWLDGGRFRDTWLEVFLADLAGLMRLLNAVPFLLEQLGHESDAMTDSAQAALWKIGGGSVVDAIGRRFPGGSADFKLYATGVLGGIHMQESEDLCLQLLRQERKASNRAELLRALADNFSTHAIELMRQELGARTDAYSAVDMEEDLLMLSLALGASIPGERELLVERDRRHERLERVVTMHRTGKTLEELENAWDEEPLTSREIEDALFGVQKPTWALQPPARKKVPPNAPCTCGSGKKYKKCCGRL